MGVAMRSQGRGLRARCRSIAICALGAGILGCAGSSGRLARDGAGERPAVSRGPAPLHREARAGQPPILRRHVVKPGETLWRIAKQHGSSVSAIAKANGIRDVTKIAVGQRLLVPSGSESALPASPDVSARRWMASDARGRSDPAGRFLWPVRGRLSSGFGLRGNHHHDGIDITAPRGTPVYAAASGRVIHADASLAGYGKMIIIKHSDRYSTVYAHNDALLVRVGQFVDQGERIALVGKTGRASSPHLHFEVRYDGQPRDPRAHLK